MGIAYVRNQVASRILYEPILSEGDFVSDGEYEVYHACHKEDEHQIEEVANVKTMAADDSKNENYGDEYIGNCAMQAIASYTPARALHIDDGESDGKCRRGVE